MRVARTLELGVDQLIVPAVVASAVSLRFKRGVGADRHSGARGYMSEAPVYVLGPEGQFTEKF